MSSTYDRANRVRRNTAQNVAATVFLVSKAPRSAPEVGRLLNIHADVAMNYLKTLEAEGLATRLPDDRKPAIFAWQHQPHNVIHHRRAA